MTEPKPDHEGLYPALLAAQAEFTPVPLDGKNPHFKSRYATLGAIMDATFPALARHGLVVAQMLRAEGLVTRLVHAASGETLDSLHPMPTGLAPQQYGSAITYARRYSLAALLCVIGEEDDDGEAAQAGARHHRDPPKPREDEKRDEEAPPGTVKANTKAEFVDGIKAAIVGARSVEALDEIADANKASLARLKKDDGKTFDQIVHIAKLRREQLERTDPDLDDEIPF